MSESGSRRSWPWDIDPSGSFSHARESKLSERLYEAGSASPPLKPKAGDGAVDILFSVIKRKDLDKAVKIIESSRLNVFYSVEEAKSVSKGVFPSEERSWIMLFFRKRNYLRARKMKEATTVRGKSSADDGLRYNIGEYLIPSVFET
jgi:hypothetical protein